MKTKFLKYSTLVLALFIAFTSCKKESDTAVTITATPAEYLTAGSWKTTAITINPGIDLGDGVLFTDLFSQMDLCEKDDLVIFNTNGTITADEGAIKCDPEMPQTSPDGTWKLSTDNKTLTIDSVDPNSGEPAVLATIVTLNSTTIVVNFDATDLGMNKDIAASYKYTLTMIRQ